MNQQNKFVTIITMESLVGIMQIEQGKIIIKSNYGRLSQDLMTCEDKITNNWQGHKTTTESELVNNK